LTKLYTDGQEKMQAKSKENEKAQGISINKNSLAKTKSL
jgi:hypothetical protein